MKITSFEIRKVPPSWVWLFVHTDAGISGIGEPFLEGHPEAVIAEVQRLEAVLLGKDPRQIELLWDLMYNAGLGYKGGPVTMSALSGIDMALWDIAGKAAGQPLYQMLGGACRDRVRMYRATGGALPHTVEPGQPYRAGYAAQQKPQRRNDDPQAWAACAQVIVQEWGFRALKAHFGPGEGLEVTAKVDQWAAIFAAIKEVVARPELVEGRPSTSSGRATTGVDVAVDIHNPHPRIAMQMIAALEPLRPLFIEEPMPVERVDVLDQIAQTTRAPLAAGERWMGKWIFFDALRSGSLAVVQPDLAHAGGITECKKIAAIAEAAYAKVALHAPLSPVALAASIALDACLPNFLVQEHNEVNDWRENGRTYIGKGYLKNPFVLDEEGCVAVSQAPGLGIELDEDGLRDIMRRPWSTQRG